MSTVLVVDDTPATLKLVTVLLRAAGHEILQARRADEALELARTRAPSLILMDVQLPGMDGLEATRLLKQDEATRAIPVLALTALAMKGDEERVRAAGCDGYVAKPFQTQALMAQVARMLAQDRAA